MGGTAGVAAALMAGVWVAVAIGDPAPPPHVLAEVLTCQPDPPSLQLSLTLDSSPLFHFDFPRSHWAPGSLAPPPAGVPAPRPWPGGMETPSQILEEAQMCREILERISKRWTGKIPEVKGNPSITIFPVSPPVLGEPNVLVCLVENVFPPALDLGWSRCGVPVTLGVTLSPWVPRADLTFGRISRIAVVPALGDVHSCMLRSRNGNITAIAYWVPPDTRPDEQLPTALTGAVTALGIVLGIIGVTLALLARRGRG